MKLVSCIMPTRGRPELAALAVECFHAQTYPNRELLILDDASDPSFSGSFGANVKHAHISKRLTVGAKRNMLAMMASGFYVAHFDSDDWSDPSRLALQVHDIEDAGKAVCGLSSLLFIDEDRQRLYRYQREAFAFGTSLLYRREWWLRHPFNDVSVGEDNGFVYAARKADELVTIKDGGLMVARIHKGNTSRKRPERCSDYRPIPMSELPAGFPIAINA